MQKHQKANTIKPLEDTREKSNDLGEMNDF